MVFVCSVNVRTMLAPDQQISGILWPLPRCDVIERLWVLYASSPTVLAELWLTVAPVCASHTELLVALALVLHSWKPAGLMCWEREMLHITCCKRTFASRLQLSLVISRDTTWLYDRCLLFTILGTKRFHQQNERFLQFCTCLSVCPSVSLALCC